MTRCFVIGPIGDKFAPFGSEARERYEDALQVFEHVILPACSANNIDPVRADQIAKAGDITEQIFRHLAEDEVVIADVSGGNPNVMYELGLRHTRNMLTVQIGEYGQLPFDVNAIRTIQFSRSPRGLIEARQQLQEALAVGIAEGGDPVTATRIWAGLNGSEASGGVVAVEPVGEEEAEESLDESGFLDLMSSIEETFPRMTDRVEEIGEILNSLAAESQTVGQEMQLMNSSQSPVKARLSAVHSFSQTIQPYADQLTVKTAEFADDMGSIDHAVSGILAHIDENPQSIDEAEGFLDSLVNLAQSSRDGMEGMNQFGGVVRDLGKISKLLRRPGQQMAKAIDTMAKATAVMDDWEAEASRLRRKYERQDEDAMQAE